MPALPSMPHVFAAIGKPIPPPDGFTRYIVEGVIFEIRYRTPKWMRLANKVELVITGGGYGKAGMVRRVTLYSGPSFSREETKVTRDLLPEEVKQIQGKFNEVLAFQKKWDEGLKVVADREIQKRERKVAIASLLPHRFTVEGTAIGKKTVHTKPVNGPFRFDIHTETVEVSVSRLPVELVAEFVCAMETFTREHGL